MTNNFTLPPAPKDLFFKADDFIASDFDVDTFLQEHRKNASLETMRDDLGVYLKILRSAMIELINKDYADFVNLSKNLIGLDKAIDQLQTPLGQLREEVMQICQTLDITTRDMTCRLEEHRCIREQKQRMQSLGRVYKSVGKLRQILDAQIVTLDTLERAATEFNHLQFHVTHCKPYISQELNASCEDLEKLLMQSLATQLLQFVEKPQADSLPRCLRIYTTLDKIEAAENLVRTKIMSVLIDDIIVEKNISNESLGLRGLYMQLLSILDVEMKELLLVTSKPDKTAGRGFNFLVNSFWPEVEEKIELRLKAIFAPGNPELFHQRYTESLEFLSHLENRCINPETLSQFCNHPLYLQFKKKWNLPVYFQIRFQEIAVTVEQALSVPASRTSVISNTANLSDDNFSLQSTETVWNCLLKTWSEGIFIPQLLHQFWKFNLQICSRYRTWSTNVLSQPWTSVPPTTASSSNVIEPEGPMRIEFLVYLYVDLEKLSKRLKDILTIVLSKLDNVKSTVIKLLEESLAEMEQTLKSDLPNITRELVQELLAKSGPNLKQVSDIPRLFRRTMRERPTQPCAYIKNALGTLINFNSTYQTALQEPVNNWLHLTLSALTEQYYASVKDVLESVQKTEESLRRLKKIRDRSSGVTQTEVQGMSDDEKIRIQLEIDVLSFVDTIKGLKIDISNIPQLNELVQIVKAAVKLKSELR